MEHRQFGYVCLFAVAFTSVNCSTPFSTSGLDSAGGSSPTGGSSSGGSGGTGGIVATGGGGSGGTILVGGGSGGSGGEPLVGGSGGTGGQGGVVSPVYCGPDQVSIPTSGVVICWYLGADHHPPGTTLGLGGLIKQPGSPIIGDTTFPGCTTANDADNTLVCPFGNLAVGTDFVFDPYATDGVATFIRCDLTGFPTSKCFGEYWVFVDGVEVAYFIDPPTGRWSYDNGGSHLRLVYTDPG